MGTFIQFCRTPVMFVFFLCILHDENFITQHKKKAVSSALDLCTSLVFNMGNLKKKELTNLFRLRLILEHNNFLGIMFSRPSFWIGFL